MLQAIGIVIVLVIAAMLIFAATRPNSFRIERSALIKAPPEKIFTHINDFRLWEPWSPWEKLDPALTRTYSGAPSGVGAVYEWKGNRQVGSGRMQIVESTAPSKVVLTLHFITPFEAHNTVEFVLTPEGGATKVTQAMYGPRPFISKLMGLFFSMDKMVGDKYEEGLASLALIAQK